MKIHNPLPEKKTRLEIIPLIDVMFFLLASFMMVSLTMTKQKTITVNLPVATSAKTDLKPETINLAVNAPGDVFFDKESVSLPEMDRRLSERFGKDPSVPVYISADVNTRYSDLVKVLDAAKRVGFTKVAFNVKPAASGTAAPAPTPQ